MDTRSNKTLAKIHDEPILPGARDIEDGLIAEAVNALNRLYAAKSVETSCVVGQYILDNFFGGSLESFNTWGAKHLTFGRLIELAQDRDNSPLHISASGLWYSVRILEQTKAFPPEIAQALPITHHRMLTAVKDEKVKLKLAIEAVSKAIPSREFQAVVRTAREEELAAADRRFSSGRPAMPSFAKGMKQLVKAVDVAVSERITKSCFEIYDVEQTRSLMKTVDKSLAKLQSLRTQIEKQLESLEG